MSTTRYVCGFAFNVCARPLPEVLLIRKKRPGWQAGRLNGIGGHIEPVEEAAQAMRREFLEEAGVDIPHWQYIAILTGKDFIVHFFATFLDRERFKAARPMTDELLEVHPVQELPHLPVIENLRVLIPLALDRSGIVKPVSLFDSIPNSAQAGTR